MAYSSRIFPLHCRDNPSGYGYFCRVAAEMKIKRESFPEVDPGTLLKSEIVIFKRYAEESE
jgi:hypothetical protein